MSDQDDRRRPHFVLQDQGQSEPFQRPSGGGGGGKEVPTRDRAQHGGYLSERVAALKTAAEEWHAAQADAGLDSGLGIQIEFESFPDVELAFIRLGNDQQRIELLNVREEDEKTLATVFVPDGKLAHFEKMISDYLEERTRADGQPLDRRKLIDAIQDIRAASLRALWTDETELFPDDDEGAFWWEIWLPVRRDRREVTGTFREMAQGLNLEVAEGELEFPERTVLLARASAAQMQRSIIVLNSIAELRRAKTTADFFDGLPADEQAQWLDDLLARTTFSGDANSPYVCILDTGINQGHPLLAPVLSAADLHTIDPAWGVQDDHGHGTAMAGLTLAGDLRPWLDSDDLLDVPHRLESVKLLRWDGDNPGDSEHHGYLTVEAVSRTEITDPERRRAFELAVATPDGRDRGRPSSWSAAIDSLAADADNAGGMSRLFLVSAGNVPMHLWVNYPDSNSADSIHDPGQSWNAVTIGAFTEMTHIDEDDAEAYSPLAADGALSPFSTTSQTWQKEWPIKPDVVFEGGNAGIDGNGPVTFRSLSLVTTDHETEQRLFSTVNGTSAATALAGEFAARLMAQYPDLWPESIRALMVHSADWTPAMIATYLPKDRQPNKGHYLQLVRHCGFGVPDLDRAMWSLDNSLTLVAEDRLNPFKKEQEKSNVTLCDMNLHQLPWPLHELEALGETQVQMRVTLSYFIEPNPSNRGFRDRYRYQSHGLRFEVKRASETEQGFRARINASAADADAGSQGGGTDPAWLIGPDSRHRGSLHSDIWIGTAADLASRGVLAVYPTSGWWKERTRLQRYDRVARYALVVSIHAPEVDVDLYTPVANQLQVPIAVET